MQLPDVKALRELLKLLRSQGVLQYQSTDLNLVLSENAPQSTRIRSLAEETVTEDEDSEAEYERLLFYSATPPTETPES